MGEKYKGLEAFDEVERLLVLAAHPDDLECLCGGVISLLTARGVEVISVNVSEAKGTVKQPVDRIRIDSHGIEGDAHAGAWHRQVSLLADEDIHHVCDLVEVFHGRPGHAC